MTAAATVTPEHAVDPSLVVGIPQKDLGWNIFRNSAAQLAGRIILAAARLAVVSIIVRTFGKGTFGEYSLIFTILTIAEWLIDFGTTEIFVREVCREPAGSSRFLRVLTAAKIVQVPVAALIVALILLALRYPAHVVQAGLMGTLSLVFFAGVLIYRTVFRVTLRMDREVGAEIISVITMIPLVALVAMRGGGLFWLIGCHVVSRVVFFATCFVFGRNYYRPSLQGVGWGDVKWSMSHSAAIGASGLLVVVYETIDVLLLSRLSGMSDVAFYAAAQKFVWPLLLMQASVGGTLYSVAASYWPGARARFEEACQRGLDAVFLLAGAAISLLVSGAAFFMGLLGGEVNEGAPALQILALLCFVKAISGTLGPILYIVHAQDRVLKLIIAALCVKAFVSSIMAVNFGYLGVALGSVAVDVGLVALPSVLLIQRLTGYRVRWRVPIKVVLAASLSSLAAIAFWKVAGFASLITAGALYAVLIFAMRTVRISEILLLVKRTQNSENQTAESQAAVNQSG